MTGLDAPPTTDARRKGLRPPKPAKVVNVLKPTVGHGTRIVPQVIIPRLTL
jgi:hypothetical protein